MRFAAKRGLTDTIETRLLVMDWAGKNARSLYKQKINRRFPQIQDDVVDFLEDDPDHILIAYDDQEIGMPSVYRVNIHTVSRTRIVYKKKMVDDWKSDHDHHIRYGIGSFERRGRQKTKAIYRKDINSDWVTLYEYDAVKENAPFSFVDFSKNSDNIFIRKSDENGRTAFYEYNVEGKKIIRKVAGSDKYDIEKISIDKEGNLESYFYYDVKPTTIYLDKDGARLARFYEKTFPNSLVYVESRTKDKKIMILKVSAPNIPPKFYMLDLNKKTLNLFAYTYTAASIEKLSEMKPISYKARDGLRIDGYLSFPKGKDPKNIPTIIMPHGGPMARDNWGFDYWVQFLTTRGYAVLQMNYRGSTGYGNEFYNRGDHEWGGKMIDDINDGTKWMIKEGYSDPKRICIMGGSYGGYAALQGVVKDPSLYKCSIAFAPVTDLTVFLRHQKNS